MRCVLTWSHAWHCKNVPGPQRTRGLGWKCASVSVCVLAAVLVRLQCSWHSLGQCVSECERASSVHLTPAGRRPAGTDQPPLLHLADWCAPVWSPLGEEWTLFTSVFALHTPGPQLSMLARHSVNRWNATLVRAHSGMKVRWTDSTMRDGLRSWSLLWLQVIL